MSSTIWTDVAAQYVEALPASATDVQDYITGLSRIDSEHKFEVDLTDDVTFEAQKVTLRDSTKGSVDDIETESKYMEFLEAARFCQVHSRFTKTHIRDIPKRDNGAPDLTKSEWESVSLVRRAEHIAKSTRDIVKDADIFRAGFTEKTHMSNVTRPLRTDATGYIQYLERGVRAGSIAAIPKGVMYDDLRDSVNSLCDATKRFYIATHQGKVDAEALKVLDAETLPGTASSKTLKRRATGNQGTSSSQGPRRTKTK
jgi:hypothetical protein